MNFIKYLITEEIQNANLEANYIISSNYKKLDKKYKASLGLVPDPDDEPDAVKAKRYDFGNFVIQPPYTYSKLNEKQRDELYKAVRKTLEMILEGVKLITNKGLGFIFTGMPDGDKTKTVIRLVADKYDEYAAMYMQEDDDKDGVWENGDFIINVFAKNHNIHTFVHEVGHKLYYEYLSNQQAEEWKEYFRIRKFKEDKHEFVSKYAKENDREDMAECFAVYVLGDERINSLYDERRLNKNVDTIVKLKTKFKTIIINPLLKRIENHNKELMKKEAQQSKSKEKIRKEQLKVLANLFNSR